MRGRLFGATDRTLFTPLIDVVCNAMAAMFIFLVIYIAVIRPRVEEKPPRLEIHNRDLPDAVWHKAYQSGIAASGGVGPYTFGIEGRLPEGLELDIRTGLIIGVPVARAGQERSPMNCAFTATVRDKKGSYDSKEFTLQVCPVAVPFNPEEQGLRIQAEIERLPEGYVGQPYEVAVGILGGIEPYRTRLEGGLPPGMDFSEGKLKGTPEEKGEYRFTVMVEDEQDHYGLKAEQGTPIVAYRHYVLPIAKLEPLTLYPLFPDGRVDEPYGGTVAVAGGASPYKWRIARGQLPSGLKPPDNGTVAGRPTLVGKYAFTIRVEDKFDQSAETLVNLEILPPKPTFEIVTKTLPSGRVGFLYSAALAWAGMTEPVQWGLLSGELPVGLSLRGAVLQGTPIDPGIWDFTVFVTDAKGKEERAGYRIQVYPRILPLQLVPVGETR